VRHFIQQGFEGLRASSNSVILGKPHNADLEERRAFNQYFTCFTVFNHQVTTGKLRTGQLTIA
jgi:hypothetical protein